MLTWFPVVHELAKHYRVVVFDQRWHGRGIVSEHFSLHDCADDVAAVITELGLERPDRRRLLDGLGGRPARLAPAPRRRRRPGPGAPPPTTSAPTAARSVFHSGMEISMGALRDPVEVAHRTPRRPGRRRGAGDRARPTSASGPSSEWRSTSPWAVAQAVAALGRHHSTPWLARIDVPTAVVVPQQGLGDPARPPARASPPGSPAPPCTRPTAATPACVLESDDFVPAFLEAASTSPPGWIRCTASAAVRRVAPATVLEQPRGCQATAGRVRPPALLHRGKPESRVRRELVFLAARVFAPSSPGPSSAVGLLGGLLAAAGDLGVQGVELLGELLGELPRLGHQLAAGDRARRGPCRRSTSR